MIAPHATRLLALGLVLTALGCPRPDSLSINGVSQPITELSASLGVDETGAPTLDVFVFTLGNEKADGDELGLSLTIPLPDPSEGVYDLLLGTEIPISFDYHCDCTSNSTRAAEVSGVLFLYSVSEESFSGELELYLSGPDADGTQVGEVRLFAYVDANKNPTFTY